VAKIIGIHPNTVRMYEEEGLIPKATRQENNYRVFTDRHIDQFRLARIALQVEVLQNGLRKKIIAIIKQSALGAFDDAIRLTDEYLQAVQDEIVHANEAVDSVNNLLQGSMDKDRLRLKRKDVSMQLGITMDTLRNWEMNGLVKIKRKENGYRVYNGEDLQRLKIIRSLRCANYSLSAILRMLNEMTTNANVNIHQILNSPNEDDDVISVCDRLITSLNGAQENAETIKSMLITMKNKY
jgi:DNA-binding transcriptional MerR regulator